MSETVLVQEHPLPLLYRMSSSQPQACSIPQVCPTMWTLSPVLCAVYVEFWHEALSWSLGLLFLDLVSVVGSLFLARVVMNTDSEIYYLGLLIWPLGLGSVYKGQTSLTWYVFFYISVCLMEQGVWEQHGESVLCFSMGNYVWRRSLKHLSQILRWDFHWQPLTVLT